MNQALAPPAIPDHQYTLTDCTKIALILDAQIGRALVSLFDTARTDIFICQYQFRVPHNPRPEMRAITNALLRAAGRNVTIRILLNHPAAGDEQRKDHGILVKTLTAPGITIRHHNADRILHAKLTIIDETVVVLGSHNFSQPSLTTSRNVSAIIHSPTMALRLLRVYEPLWHGAANGAG